MKKTTLNKIVSVRGGALRIAKMLNIQPSAVQKAVEVGRNITIIEHDDGKVEGYEVRPFPFKSR